MRHVAQVILSHRFVRVGLPVMIAISLGAFLLCWATGDSRICAVALDLSVFFIVLQVGGWIFLLSGQVETLQGSLRNQDLLLEETGRIGKIGGWEHDVETGAVTWTRETAEIHGMGAHEKLDLELSLSVCAPAYREEVRQAVDLAFKEGRPYDMQYEMILRSGETKWVRTVGRPVMKEGRVIKLRGIIQDITALRTAELAASFSEGHLRAMTELNPDCVKVINAEGELAEMNQAGLAMLEVANFEEAQQQSLLKYVETEYRPAFRKLHRNVMRGESDSLEFMIRGRRGTIRHAFIQAVPMRDLHGKVNALLGITRDITNQVREKALAEGQREVLEMIAGGAELKPTMDRLLEVIENHSPDMLCSLLLMDAENQCLRACSAPRLPPEYVEATDGLKIGESVGSCGTAAFRREAVFVEDITTDPLWAVFREFVEGHGLKACWSTPILGADGEVLATFAVYYDRPAKPTDEHLRLIELATHTASICLVRHRSEAALRESEWRFRRVIESINEVFWMRTESSGRILYVSPKYEKLWGQPMAELYKDGHSWLTNVHPEDQERMQQVFREPARKGHDEMFRIIHPEKGIRWVRSRAFVYQNPDGVIGGWVGVASDVTEQKQMEEQLFKSQRLEAVGTLAGGVAHDLNNILAPILVACGMLKDEVGLSQARAMVETLEKSAQRGASIIQKLLDFSRGGEGTVTPTDPRFLVREVYELIRGTFPKQITIKEDLEDSLWGVKVDAAHVHQILMNLCVNARDAMPRGGNLLIRAANVEIGPQNRKAHFDATEGRYVLLSVSDDGAGMNPEVLNRVFDPFFTTKEVGKGSGLGLPSVLGIVRGYHGFVGITSEVGRGTEVKIYLPAMMESVEMLAAPSETMPVGNGELILFVDDETSICDTISVLLKKSGYRVLTAENGRVALDQIREHRHDLKLVVTDIVMPVMDGIALIGEIQRDFPDLKIIATSGLTGEAELKSSGVREVAGFMEKPYPRNALLQRIHQVLTT